MTVKSNPKEAFLFECLDYLEGDINDDDKMDFYSACITYMAEHNELLSSNLQDCYSGFKEKGDRTLINWINKLVELLESEKRNLWVNRKDSLLTKFPMIKKNLRQSGGAGNKTNYSIVPSDIDEIENDTVNIFITKNNKEVRNEYFTVKYHSKKLEKTPSYIKISSRFFTERKSRQRFAVLLLILAIISFIVFSVAVTGKLSLYSSIGVVVFCMFIMNPVRYLLSISINKACLIEHIFSSVSTICISEVIPSDKAKNSDNLERRLLTRIVEGDCPICMAKYQLEKSVLLENKGLFRKKIIGVCSNNPKEHKFSFDKDLMAGEKI